MHYLIKKICQMFLTIVLLTTIVFFIARSAPGDPLVAYYGDGAERLSQTERTLAMGRLGLNKPLLHQYKDWLLNVTHGDFGISYKYKQAAGDIVFMFTKNTIILYLTAYALTFFLAIMLAIICVYKQEQWLDLLICKIGVLTASIPAFWIALLLILLFSVNLKWLPSSGAYPLSSTDTLFNRLPHLVLPCAALILSHLWYYTYIIRNKLIAETHKDYVLLCRAKGIAKMTILWCHCLRNVAPAIFTMMGLAVPHLIGGTYVIEKIFSYPGLGSLVFESARYHDYNLLMILTILTGITVVIISFLVDIINRFIDPRLRNEGGNIL